MSFNKSFPRHYACPLPKSCLGGMKSECVTGYEGPLCAVCSDGFYKMVASCQQCPSVPWLVAQICVAFIIVAAIAIPIAMGKNVQNQEGRALSDIVLARLKIIVGFYQVTSGTLDTFSYIQWPGVLMQMIQYANLLQLNLLQIVPINCFSDSIRVNSYTNLAMFAGLIFTTPLVVTVVYHLRIVFARKMTDSTNIGENDSLQSSFKEKCYRAVFLILFIVYPAASAQTFQMLPAACHKICVDTDEHSCEEYLRSDYTIKCYSKEYNKYVSIAYGMLAFVLGYPLAILLLLWKRRNKLTANVADGTKGNKGNELSAGLGFLYENYSENCWFWEVLELVRKVILTSVLVLIGGESRTHLGTAAIVSGLYAVLFASYQPISDRFEHWLQLVSLMATCANMNVGMLLKIPEQEISSGIGTESESVVVTILLVLANLLVTGMVVGKHAISLADKVLRSLKNLFPRGSVFCIF